MEGDLTTPVFAVDRTDTTAGRFLSSGILVSHL